MLDCLMLGKKDCWHDCSNLQKITSTCAQSSKQNNSLMTDVKFCFKFKNIWPAVTQKIGKSKVVRKTSLLHSKHGKSDFWHLS